MIKQSKNTLVLVGLAVLVLACWNATGAKPEMKKHKKHKLHPAAAVAIQKAFPDATVGKVEREKESLVLYEVELEQSGKKMEVTVAADGLIVEIENDVARSDLPAPVAAALTKLAGNGKIKEIEKEKTHAILKLVKLDTPKVVYEVELVQDGKDVEVKIDQNGKVLSRKTAHDEDDHNGHER